MTAGACGRALLTVLALLIGAVTSPARAAPIKISKEAQACVGCHESQSPAFVKEWRKSKHAAKGVDCLTCHKADKKDPDAMEHNGFTIAILVTPQDCSRCHAKEVKEMTSSHHAKAGDILDSLDNFLGEVVGGPEAVAVGCVQCHGSKVKVLANGKLDINTWPNTGIGRINPDGSLGSCSACHARHDFSKAQARQPEACGKCHLGPDHPQAEVYQESKHGILYAANKERLNLGKNTWVVGKDYSAAPTCTTCHMGATPKQPPTHDVGARISWTLRPPISKKLENADRRRDNMKDVCANCHAAPFVDGFYVQFDNLVNLYNDKFAKPATAIRNELMDKGKLTRADFDEKLDWIYYELWHHEGRRARHGASMSGPDYAWWHGMYDVAKNFYTEFLPEVKRVAGPELYAELSKKYLETDVRHEWYVKGMSKEQLEKIRKYYEERYGKGEAAAK
ncbi:MAG TPA: multiheme c-type cytochrome [Burkholderiales bacterium]|nr:multiheme c-type cytochrome [Burkholderiales bacterium]